MPNTTTHCLVKMSGFVPGGQGFEATTNTAATETCTPDPLEALLDAELELELDEEVSVVKFGFEGAVVELVDALVVLLS